MTGSESSGSMSRQRSKKLEQVIVPWSRQYCSSTPDPRHSKPPKQRIKIRRTILGPNVHRSSSHGQDPWTGSESSGSKSRHRSKEPESSTSSIQCVVDGRRQHVHVLSIQHSVDGRKGWTDDPPMSSGWTLTGSSSPRPEPKQTTQAEDQAL